jgi:hypothetical protein
MMEEILRMSANFQVGFQKKNGILYVDPKGDFDGSSAWELANLIQDHYDGDGPVVIDTHQLRNLCPFGCSTFKCRIRIGRVPAERLVIKGALGKEIAPEGCRFQEVGADKHQHCAGKCKDCRCRKERASGNHR